MENSFPLPKISFSKYTDGHQAGELSGELNQLRMGWTCWHRFPVLQKAFLLPHPTAPGAGNQGMAKPKVGQCLLPQPRTCCGPEHGERPQPRAHCAPCSGPPAQGLSRPWALWMQRVSRQSLTCVHNSCWPPLSPSRHLSEPEICRASPGCLFDALFLNNSQIFKQHFYQHYMFRRHPGMSRVPELAGPHWAQPCSSAELLSGLQLTPAHALPLASGAELSAPRREGSRETGWVCTVWLSETPVWLWFSWDSILGDNTEPRVTAENINIQFLVFVSLCLSGFAYLLLQELIASILANKPLLVLRKAVSPSLETNSARAPVILQCEDKS